MGRTLRIEAPRVFVPLLRPARYKGIWGGRGSGKSHFAAEHAVIVRAIANPGSRIVCVREVQKSLQQSVKRLLEDKLQQYQLTELFKIQNTQIGTPGGGVIIFAGMQEHTAESIKSLEGFDVAWVEEAQSLSQRSLDLLRPTIRKPNSEIWATWNPKNATDPIDRFLRTDDLPPGAVVVKANYSDNPWFPAVLRADMEYDRRRDIEKYRHVWEGEYEKNSEARVFKNWTVAEFDVPDDAPLLHGGDWGFSTDPTAGVRCFVEGRTLKIAYEVYKVGCEIDDTPALFDSLGCTATACAGAACNAPGHASSRRWPFVADSARPETISYMRRNGYPRMEPAHKGAGSVEDGVAFLQSYDIVVHPRCIHTIDELSSYKYRVDLLTGNVLPILVDADNH